MSRILYVSAVTSYFIGWAAWLGTEVKSTRPPRPSKMPCKSGNIGSRGYTGNMLLQYLSGNAIKKWFFVFFKESMYLFDSVTSFSN